MKKVLLLILMGMMVLSLSVYAQDSVELESQGDSASGEALKELGLIEGNGKGLNESGDITREAIVKMLVSLTTDLSADFDLPEIPTFSDVPKEHWAYSWVERAYAADLTKGIGGGLFGLGNNVTKQQVSAFMLNALNEEYTYALAEGAASLKGISTEVVENFNRGNSFEMVTKTLLQVPKGQEKALYELTMNFKGKNFRKVVADIELRKDEERKVAEAIAEAARIKDEKMSTYRNTWPNNQETYLEWLDEMEEILEPLWVESTNEELNSKGHDNIIFSKLIDDTTTIRVKINADDTITIKYDNWSYLDTSLNTSFFLKNTKVWYVEAYDSIKIMGNYEGEIYTLVMTNDMNNGDVKGSLKISKEQYITKLIYHSSIRNGFDTYDDLYNRKRTEGFASIDLKTFQSIVTEDLTLDMVCGVLNRLELFNYSSRVGLDEYKIKLTNLVMKPSKTGGSAIHVTVEQAYDKKTTELAVTSLEQNAKGDMFVLQSYLEDNHVMVLTIKMDENNKIEKAYIQYGDNSGSYIRK